jgi:hypothetical protein
MISEVRFIPDLAGAGNLIVTRTGHVKLVDINNISPVAFDDAIPLDDKGYPVCDKSIEALALMEAKFLGRAIDGNEAVYRHFLDPARLERVRDHEAAFHRRMA